MINEGEMAECCVCGSGTYDPKVIHFKMGECEAYCDRCYKVWLSPVDKSVDNTPEVR